METPVEVWLELHYRYRDEDYRYNLPIPNEGKYLDGVKIELETTPIHLGRRYRLILEPLGHVDLDSLAISGHLTNSKNVRSIFANGYQSWTESREFHPRERIKSLRWPGQLFKLDRYGDSWFYPYREKRGYFHGYGYGILRNTDGIFLAGSLDESKGYTIFESDVRHEVFAVRKDVQGQRLDGRRAVLDLVTMEGEEDEVMREWWQHRGISPLPAKRAAGWTSWYYHYGKIEETIVRKNLAAFRERRIPLTYFQIDDGWQRTVGDWGETAATFPSGMGALAAEVRGSGYVPGLWLAPFLAAKDSRIVRTQRDWLARDRKGRIRPAGWNPEWGGRFYALDLDHHEVRDYLSDVFRKIREEWGFGFFKLDFLYAAALFPSPGKSRGEAMNDAMEFLGSLKGDSTYLACGVPLVHAFGRVEYCRIGADVAPYWEDRLQRNLRFRERVSTVNALRSTLGRRHLNRRVFANDPDVYFLRSRSIKLEPERRYTLYILNALFGELLFTSDDISEYEDDQNDLYLAQFPLVEPEIRRVVEARRTITIHFSVKERRYLTTSNLASRHRTITLPEGRWFGIPAPGRRGHHLVGGRKLNLKPGETRCYLELGADRFFGSDGHIFPGVEISEIDGEENHWMVYPSEKSIRPKITVWIRVDQGGEATVNGTPVPVIRASWGDYLALATIDNENRPTGPPSTP